MNSTSPSAWTPLYLRSRGIPVLLTQFGNPNIKNEWLIAPEMGYRTMVSQQLSIDFTAYYNNYPS